MSNESTETVKTFDYNNSTPSQSNVENALNKYGGCKLLILRVEERNKTHLKVNFEHQVIDGADVKDKIYYVIPIKEVLNAGDIPEIERSRVLNEEDKIETKSMALEQLQRGRIVCVGNETYAEINAIATSQNPCPGTKVVYFSDGDSLNFDVI